MHYTKHSTIKRWLPVSAFNASLILYLLSALLINQVFAQSEPSDSEPQILKQQFQEELDRWVLQAYEGDPDAQFKVAVLFTNDQFTPPDFEQAVYWYKQAAEQNHRLAQYNLGHQYLNGVGVKQNEETAVQWWLKAAKLDHPLAQFNVGRAYYLGIGLTEDHTQAKYWFRQAASNQEEKSIEILAQLGWDQSDQSSQSKTTKTVAAPVQPKTSSTATPNTNINSTEEKSTSNSQNESNNSGSIALYTDPSIRSLLISIVDDSSELSIVNTSEVWSSVQHSAGFPIWAHSNFLSIDGDNAVVTGRNVNARSIPMVVRGSVIGKLNEGDVVNVLNFVGEWYRVTSPNRFKAWVRTADLKKALNTNTFDAKPIQNLISNTVEKNEATQKQDPEQNSDQWLFSQPPSNYTVQLASLDSTKKAATFLAKSKLKNDPNLYQLSSTSNNINWTYFLYGSYSDRKMAEAIKDKLKNQRVWPRNLGKLQQSRCVSWKKQIPAPKELNIYCKP